MADRMPTFAEWTQALHGEDRRPFPWQAELAERILSGEWPQVLDPPTGLGKTAVLDVAVYAQAAEAHLPPAERRAPTRTLYIVGRRVIVDAATEHAQKMAQRLAHPGGNEVLREMADRLRRRRHEAPNGSDEPLSVTRMRGGVTWDWRWVRSTDQPAIITGTIDQLGSRFLFRGYGTGDRLRPIDAALVGNDALVFLDEAHLASAFFETHATARALEDACEREVLAHRPVRMVQMTATPPVGRDDIDRFGITEADEQDQVAGPRLAALKELFPVDLGHLTGKKWADSKAKKYADAVARLALARCDEPGAVGLVVLNTVSMARLVHSVIDRDRDVDSALVIGKCRPIDRQISQEAWWDRVKTDRTRSLESRPLLVVATQTIEVGADLDADFLVTEAAPVDALIQRMGRVDRSGELQSTRSLLVSAPLAREADFVYGAATAEAWQWLVDLAGGATEVTGVRDLTKVDYSGPSVDAGPLALREHLESVQGRDRLLAARAEPPVLTPPVLDCLARTGPRPHPDEDVSSYLHGIDRGEPTVSVIWRAGLSDEGRGDTEQSLAPAPVAEETVEVSLSQIRRFVGGLEPAASDSDLEGAPLADADEGAGASGKAVAFRFDDKAGVLRRVGRPRDIGPGDLVVLDSSAGGHDQFGWTGESGSAVADVRDLCHSRRVTLRPDLEVLKSLFARVDTAVLRSQETPYDGSKKSDPLTDRLKPAIRALELVVRFNRGDETLSSDEVRAALDAAAGVAEGASQDSAESDLLAPAVRILVKALVSIVEELEDTGSEVFYGARIKELCRQFGGVDSWAVMPRAASGVGAVRAELKETEDSLQVESLLLEVHRPYLAEESAEASPGIDMGDTDDASSFPTGSFFGATGEQSEPDLSLETHLNDVGQRAERVARSLGMDDDLVQTLRFAARLHDAGKADRRFQEMLAPEDQLALEVSAGEPKLLKAKSAHGKPRSGRRGGLAWPPGMRHEAISVELMESWPPEERPAGVDWELAIHLVASHHGHARPLFPPVLDEDPVPVALVWDDVKLSVERPRSVDWSQPGRFQGLRQRYGTWGLALLEATLRLADIAVSEELVAKEER